MIRWLKDYIGTASYMEEAANCSERGLACLDVRDLVDKRGNTPQSIAGKIQEGVRLLSAGEKVVVCCDYGLSRSNSLAAGIIARYENRPFEEVVNEILQIIGDGGIKIEVLNMVRASLGTEDEHLRPNPKPVILVTGGSGFIGRSLIPKIGTYAEVVAPSSGDIDLENDLVRLDLLVKKTRPSHIVHLANPRVYTATSALGKTLCMLKNVLDICSTNEVKLIFPSSWEVYSAYEAGLLSASENLPLFAKGTYGETKVFCEQMIRNYSRLYGQSYAIVRFSPVYGSHSERPKFIYNFIDKALKNQPITTHMYRNGSPLIDLLHVDDAVEALYKVIQNDLSGEYNVGTGKVLSTKQVADLIVQAAESTNVVTHNDVAGNAPNIAMDAAKIKRHVGWEPTTVFKDWLIQKVKSIENNGSRER